MSELVICGHRKLYGECSVQGAKNGVLPILAATILHKGECVIHNCPDLSDVTSATKILEALGAKVKREGTTLVVDTKDIMCCDICEELMSTMRSSIMFIGAILGRCHRAVMSIPGGCEIGTRPIDIHLKGFSKMGIKIKESDGRTECECERIVGEKIYLDFPSVGATENIMLAATLADGETVIHNCAKEPEITDLARFLRKMGANICGEGTSVIRIKGVTKLYDATYTVMPDRIVTATYLCAGAITQGDVFVRGAREEDSGAFLSVLEDTGCIITADTDGIRLKAPQRLKAVDMIRTMPYPGFPTDAQAPFVAILSKAKGTSMMVENIFENRYRHVGDLIHMGANITVENRVAVIKGVSALYGARVRATDLRGGAALVVAALGAEGTTHIGGICHIQRGYESIERDLQMLGADIKN